MIVLSKPGVSFCCRWHRSIFPAKSSMYTRICIYTAMIMHIRSNISLLFAIFPALMIAQSFCPQPAPPICRR